MATCGINIDNINKTNCKELLGQVTGVWLDTDNTGVTFADALLEATWTAKIQEAITSRMFVVMPKAAYDVTRNLEEAVMPRGNTGVMEKARNGYLSYVFSLTNLKDTYWNALKTLDGLNLYAWFHTNEEKILASNTTTNVIPVPSQVFVSEVATPETADEFSRLNITVNVIPTSGYFTKVISPTAFTPSLLDGLIEVTASVVTASAAASTVVFTATEALDGTTITSGFVTGSDWVIEKESDGSLQYFTAVSYGSGVWTGTAVTIVDGDTYYIYRKTADVATDKSYEMREANKVSFVGAA